MAKNPRMIDLPTPKIREAIKLMEWMDSFKPDSEAIGGSIKAGKKWTEFDHYRNLVYTLERRGEAR